MTRYIKLPNNETVKMNDNGFIQIRVNVSLNDIINRDKEGFFDHLSMLSTGTELLSDISYQISRVIDSFRIEIMVTGKVRDIDYDEMLEQHLPMKAFDIKVTRASYCTRTLQVKACTKQDALEMAGEDAGNHLYLEEHADYEFDVL